MKLMQSSGGRRRGPRRRCWRVVYAHRIRVADAGRRPRADALTRSQLLEAADFVLREHEANLRNAERLLGLGSWKMYLQSKMLTWSDITYTRRGRG